MTPLPTDDRFADAWRAHRAYLVDLAFRMLGDVGAAEDAVQEAFTRLARIPPEQVNDDRGWLTVVTSRLCLDRIRAAHTRRESAQDAATVESARPLAQAPPVDPADRITLDDQVRRALLVVLQRLSPAERVAFVLHDVFQTPFEVIADTLGKPTGTCRQLARRARQKIADAPQHPHDVQEAEHRLVAEKFMTACANGDLDGLLAVLHPRVWGVAEFQAGSAIEPELRYGSDDVGRTLLRYYGHPVTLVSHPANDEPTLLGYLHRKRFAVLTLTVHGDLITKVHATVTDPPGHNEA